MSERWHDGTFDDGSRPPQHRLRNRMARLCRGSSKDADKRVRVSRVFKSVVAGLPAAGAAEIEIAA